MTTPIQPAKGPGRRGESRWPMALAVLAAGVMQELIPTDFRISKVPIYLLLLACFLVVLVIGDPGRIDRERRWLRVTTGLMIGFITLGTAVTAIRLVAGILRGADWASAGQLLTIGAIVWLTNVIAFTLWYWDLDAGGAAARAAGSSAVLPAFVFPEMTHPQLVPDDWYPKFADYLALSFNTSLAFSPTDVSAVRQWAKLMTILQAMISLVVAALVIARAINIL